MKMRSTTVASPFGTNLWNCKIIRLNNLSFFLSVCSCSFCELNCILMRNWIFSCDFSPSHKSDFRRTIASGKNIPSTIVLLWKMEKFSDVISNSFFLFLCATAQWEVRIIFHLFDFQLKIVFPVVRSGGKTRINFLQFKLLPWFIYK